MDIENLAKELILKNMTPEQQMAVLESVRQSVANAKEVQKKKIGENVDLVVQALKKIEADIRDRFDAVGNSIEKRVLSIQDGRDGANGKDGRDGKDGKSGRDGLKGDRGVDGQAGRDGVDGVDGISVINAQIDFDGSLVITLSDGRELNVGEVVSADVAEKIKVISTMSTNTAIAIKDEGTSISTGVKNINFVGATVTATNSGDDVTVNVSAGTGTVTSVGGTGTVNGLTLTGTVTTSGNLTLGGTLNLSSPPAIGGTTPESGAFTTLSATGVTTVQAGTAALPAITTTGDTNTGIFFPAADTIAFTEGGAESMRISSAGNVGIGTSAPSAKLDLLDATNPVYLQQTRGSVVQLAGPVGSAVTSPGQIGTTSTSPFRFITDNIERIRLDTAGNAQFQTGAVMPYAPAPTGIAAATTLTNANIQGQIISATGTTYTITMPLGTTLETLATWQGTGVAYDFYVINTASGTVTMAVNTGVTSLGTLTIATGVSAQFRIRRTAANTFVLYRLG